MLAERRADRRAERSALAAKRIEQRDRSRTVMIDAAVILAAGAFVMVVKSDLFGSLVSFVALLACGIATWAAVFVVDMAMRRSYDSASLESSGLIPTGDPSHLTAGDGVRLPALSAWLAGTVAGLLFTSSPLFTGPLAVGVFAQSSLGYLLGFAVSAIVYAVLGRGVLRQRELAQPVGATGHEEAVNVA
jgi:cytosine/uracil/thiamine/allantoin permease